MSVLNQSRDAGSGAIATPMAAPVDRTGFFENVGAGYRQAVAGPHSTRVGQALYEVRTYEQIVKAVNAEGELGTDYVRSPVKAGSPFYRPVPGERVNAQGVVYVPVKRAFRNPYAGGGPNANPVQSLYLGGDTGEVEQIFAAVARIRARNPEFLKDIPDAATVGARADEQRKKDYAAASAITERASTSGVVGQFVGGMAGSLRSGDPENLTGGFAGAAGKTVARTVIKRAVEGAGVNAAAALAATPAQVVDARNLDIEMTPADMAWQVAEAAAIGGAFGVAQVAVPKVAGKVSAAILEVAKKAGEAIVGAVEKVGGPIPLVRDAMIAASIRAGTVADREALSEWRRLHNPGGVIDSSSPDERAAAHVIERDATDREASPLQPGASADNARRLDAVAKALGVNLTPVTPSPAPIQTATVRGRGNDSPRIGDQIQWEVNGQLQFDEPTPITFVSDDGKFVMVGGSKTGIPVDQISIAQRAERRPQPRRAASYEEAVHQAEGTAKNPDSSATGHFQFTAPTWLEYAPRVTDTKGMSRAQILALRQDRGIASRAEQAFRGDNARYLRSRGVEDSPGNLSLAHFLGSADAAKVLSADPSTPIGQLVDAGSIRANRGVFKKIATAGDMVAWGHKRIGTAVDGPVARADAVPDADGLDAADYADTPYERAMFTPEQVETDAALMQYKSGGDEQGVTGKLKDVTAWDPIMSSEILVWEGGDGRRVVVDGHQRVGLAKRLAGEGQSIDMPALVVREADGITAAQARVLGALRNINLGTGTLLDNARVLRDAPHAAEMLKGAEHRREIEGLSRLSYEAFGAAINGVIDPRIAAEIGKHAPNAPETHMALAGLLAKERVSNPGEAATIVRQATADGFGTAREHQLGMFGDEPQQSLYVPIARIFAAASKKLREEKRTFRVLADKAGKIEEAGNVLDRAANQGKVVSSDEALAILDATAHSAGPVRDALIAAARAELSGARRGDAVNGFLDALAGIDLRAAARGAVEDGGPREPFGEAGGRDAAAEADRVLSDSDGPELFDHAVAAKAAAEPFSDPVGEGAKAQTALLEHDLLMDVVEQADPAIAERQRQETGLRADSPLRPGDIDPDGTMGLGLFDVADQPTFRLSDEGEARPLADIMGEAEADTLAAQALRNCLK